MAAAKRARNRQNRIQASKDYMFFSLAAFQYLENYQNRLSNGTKYDEEATSEPDADFSRLETFATALNSMTFMPDDMKTEFSSALEEAKNLHSELKEKAKPKPLEIGEENPDILPLFIAFNYRTLPDNINLQPKYDLFCKPRSRKKLNDILQSAKKNVAKMKGASPIYHRGFIETLVNAAKHDNAIVVAKDHIVASYVTINSSGKAKRNHGVDNITGLAKKFYPWKIGLGTRQQNALSLGLLNNNGAAYAIGQTVINDTYTSRLVEYGKHGVSREFVLKRDDKGIANPSLYFDPAKKVIGVVTEYAFDEKAQHILPVSTSLVDPKKLRAVYEKGAVEKGILVKSPELVNGVQEEGHALERTRTPLT